MQRAIFQQLQLPQPPVLLAPLAGVSDHPFRRICTQLGADLSYVEMISATALLYESRRTYAMLKRHESEAKLGVQITGKTADETAQAVAILSQMNFETIDINMGCPVAKVVKTGCGSGFLRDPQRVYDTVRLSVAASCKPVSAKIRLGWDRESMNALEIVDAACRGGASWICVHGRTRADDYSVPVDLNAMLEIRRRFPDIVLIGNGNLFGANDAEYMIEKTTYDGLMVSRGALGDPWVFARIKGRKDPVTVDEWHEVVATHLRWQEEEYGNQAAGFICMRKHLLWYLAGWPGVKPFKERVNQMQSIGEALAILDDCARSLSGHRFENEAAVDNQFQWDPKWEMNRQWDRGLSDEILA